MIRHVRPTISGVLFVALLAAGLSNCARAQNVYSWTNTAGDKVWTSTTNWSSTASGYPGSLSNSDTAFFAKTSLTGAINISTPITLGTLLMGSSNTTTLSGSTISISDGGEIILGTTGKTVAQVVSNPVALLGSGTIGSNNAVSGGGGVGNFNINGALTGSSVLTITSTNTGQVQFSGVTTGFTGTVNVVTTTPSTFTTGSGGLFSGNLGSAAAINFTNGAWRGVPNGQSVPITINTGWTYFDNSGTFPEQLTVTSGGTVTLGTGNGNQNNYTGLLSGPGVVTVNGNTSGLDPDVFFAGANANTLSGLVYVYQGRLNLNKSAGTSAIGTASVLVGHSANNTYGIVVWQASNQVNGNSNFTLGSFGTINSSGSASNDGQLWLNGFNDTIGGLQDTGGAGTAIVQCQNPSGTSSLTVSPSTSFNYGGILRDGTTTGEGQLSFHMGGLGVQTLSGSNLYTGATTVNSGTLTIASSLPTANITISGDLNGGGTINFGNGSSNGVIVVNSSGTLDVSQGMQFNIAGLSVSSATLASLAPGSTFDPPLSGLENLLTPASQAKFTLTNVNNLLVASQMASFSWGVDASGNWSSSVSWTNGMVPNSSGTPATFGSVITAPRTVTLDIPVTLGSMSFNNTNTYTILDTTGTNSITFNNGAEDSTISVAAGNHLINAGINVSGNNNLDVTVTPSGSTLTVAGAINSGTVNMMPGSGGTLLLTGTNNFSGGLNVQAGTVIAAGGYTLNGSVPVTVAAGGTFAITSTTNLTIGSLNCLATGSTLAINGGTLNVPSNIIANIYGLTGAGMVNLTVPGPGVTQTLGQNSNFTGTLTIANVGSGMSLISTVSAATAFGSGLNVLSNVNWGSIGNTSANFYLTGGNDQFTSAAFNFVLSGSLTVNPSTTFTMNTGSGNQTFLMGVLAGSGVFNYAGGVRQSQEFTPLILGGSNSNTFSGPYNVQTGTLLLDKTNGAIAVNGPLNIGSPSFSSSNNTTHVLLGASEQINPSMTVSFITPYSDLRLEGWNETLGGLSSSLGQGTVGVFNDSFVTNGPTGNSILTIAGAGNYSFGGALVDGGTGSLAVVMSGSGTQVLGGANTYSGGTTISGSGMLTINGSLAHANISVTADTLNGSGKIAFNPGEEIMVGAAGAVDSSGSMTWNLTALTGSPIPLLDYSGGGTYIAPSLLESLLTRDSQFLYSLTNSSGMVMAVSKTQYTWNVDASGNWSASGSWSTGVAPNAAGAVVNFLGAIGAPRTVTLDEPVTLGMMKLSNTNQYTLLDTTGTNSITLNNSGLNSVIESQQGSHLINVPIVVAGNGVLELVAQSSGGTLTMAGNISEGTAGTGVLTLDPDSTGTVALTGTNNTFTGGLSVHGGALLASSLAGTLPVSVNGGATFGVTGTEVSVTIGSLNSTASNAAIAVNGGTLNVAANGNNNVYGLTGAGTVVLNAANSGITQNLGNNAAFTGNLDINNGGIDVPLGAANAFGGTASTTTLNDVVWNTLASTSAKFHITGGTSTFASSGATSNLSGAIAIDSGATLAYNVLGVTGGTLSGAISGGGTFDDQGGSVTFSGTSANVLSGTTIVEQGAMTLHKSGTAVAITGPITIGTGSNTAVVQLGNGQQIDSAVIVSFGNNTSSLRLNSFQQTVGGLTSNTGNGEVGNYGATGSTLTINAAGNNTYGGALDDGFGGSYLAYPGERHRFPGGYWPYLLQRQSASQRRHSHSERYEYLHRQYRRARRSTHRKQRLLDTRWIEPDHRQCGRLPAPLSPPARPRPFPQFPNRARWRSRRRG